MQGWEATAAVLVAMLGQNLKARKDFSTALAQWLMLAMGIGLHALNSPPHAPYNEWAAEAIVMGLAICGTASKLGSIGWLPATDSKESPAKAG